MCRNDGNGTSMGEYQRRGRGGSRVCELRGGAESEVGQFIRTSDPFGARAVCQTLCYEL